MTVVFTICSNQLSDLDENNNYSGVDLMGSNWQKSPGKITAKPTKVNFLFQIS